MKSIYTLVPDIQEYISKNDEWYEHANEDILHHRQTETCNLHRRTRSGLRLSGLGDKCPKALWYSVHHPELAEVLPAWARFKYGYGHLIEDLVISLARLSGHTVEGEQDELVVDGIIGHRDAVVDGCILDVKSCSSIAFRKFRDRTLETDDTFGYLYQLDGYVLGSSSDPLVTVKDRGYFLAVDKTLGHMVLYEHTIRKQQITNRIRHFKSIVELSSPPRCECGTVAEGRSGNIRLDTRASYSLFKNVCYPTLRTFIYSDGPKYFTKIEREPDVPEIRH